MSDSGLSTLQRRLLAEIATDGDEEIFVNKVCCLFERSEPRDLLDLMLLEGRGMRVENYLEQAQRKDGGVSAATLAWLLSQLKIPDEVQGANGAEQLRRFAKDLGEAHAHRGEASHTVTWRAELHPARRTSAAAAMREHAVPDWRDAAML